MSIETILTPDEFVLYHRHIDDGMPLLELTSEFEMTFEELHVWFNDIEHKLRAAFNDFNEGGC